MTLKTWEGGTSSDYTLAANYKENSAPATGNAVWLQGTVAVDGVDQSSVAIDELLVELAANIGTDQAYLQVDPNSLEVNNTSGVHYLDIGTAPVGPKIKRTSTPSSGYGLYLKGSAMTTLTLNGGSVAIAGLLDESATVATIRVLSSSTLYIGPGASLTTLLVDAGSVTLDCAATTVTVNGGSLVRGGSGAVTTLNQYGGTFVDNGSGTVTNIHHHGGFMNLTGDGTSKTVTNYTVYTTGSPSLEADPAVVTFSNNPVIPTTKFRLAVSSP